MADKPTTGRSRGRARGRARGATETGATPANGNGDNGANGNGNGAAGNGANGGGPRGRASVRGAVRDLGAGEQPPTEQMASLALSGATREGVQQARKRLPRFQQYECRPAHVADKRGKSGTTQTMVSNYFPVRNHPGSMIYQYHVDFDPPVDHRGRRYAMVKGQTQILGNVQIFDGVILYLPKKLHGESTEFISESPRDGSKTRVVVKLVKELPPSSPQLVTMMNIFLRRSLELLDMKQVYRSYYMPQNKIPIPQHKMEIWPGYDTAIQQYDVEHLLMNVDITHKVLRTETVLDYLYNMYKQMKQSEAFFARATDELSGMIVMTRYNNKTYRIDDIDWDRHPDDSFEKKDGTKISYREYFSTTYNKAVTDAQQPLIICKMKLSPEEKAKGIKSRDVHLLPELCTMTGLTDAMRSDYRVMKDMHEHTRQDPNMRVRGLQQFASMMKDNPQVVDEFGRWGVVIDPKPQEVQARILPQENVFMLMRNGQPANLPYDQRSADWTRSMRDKLLLDRVNLENWLCLYTKRDEQTAEMFCGTLARVFGPMGIQTADPIALCCEDRTESYVTCLNRNVNEHTQMVVCILSSNKKERYDAIKKKCCITKPVPSQVVLSRTLSKRQMLMSVCTKIAVQVNCKLGGSPWRVDNPLKTAMVIGYDSYHDSSVKNRSVGAMVASMDPALTKYVSRCIFQHSHQELVNSVQPVLHTFLKTYQQQNGVLPAFIIIYRDGVGDGQLKDVYETEMPQFLRAFRQISSGYEPKVVFMIVKKRISTRFFMPQNGGRGGGNFQNPPPGSIVDSTVTNPKWYDFFLVSQSVREGTVAPTSFNVIHDTSGLLPDHIQRLTYKLTHLYYNWPGTVRVPAPCQYAHKLAFLTGQSLHAQPAIELCDKLFFL